MTEEEYFRKYYPDFCYYGKPLSPHWDFFQEGVEFGERQSEKKIEELEKENSELRNNGFTVSAMTEQQLKAALDKGEQLEKENADLRDNYDLFKAIAEPEIERLQKENAELKHNKKTVVHLANCLEEKMKERIEELEKENKELKELLNCNNCSELSEEECEVCAEYSHFKCKGKDQLTKATEIIKGLLSCCRNYPQENAEKMKHAEQFIKDMEK